MQAEVCSASPERYGRVHQASQGGLAQGRDNAVAAGHQLRERGIQDVVRSSCKQAHRVSAILPTTPCRRGRPSGRHVPVQAERRFMQCKHTSAATRTRARNAGMTRAEASQASEAAALLIRLQGAQQERAQLYAKLQQGAHCASTHSSQQGLIVLAAHIDTVVAVTNNVN